MVRRILLALLAIAAAPAAWYLRGQQLLAADGAESALPLPPGWLDWALWGLLAALAVLTLLLALPERKGKSLAELHTVALGTIFQGAGALLLTGGAALRLYGLYPDLRSFEAISAAILLLGALGLLIGGLRIGFGSGTRGGGALLLTMCAAAAELVFYYRAHAADPELSHYEITLLTLAAATLTAALLAGFAHGMGGRRRFLLLAGLTAALSAASLHAAASYDEALCFMGCTAAALGLFLSLLFGVPLESTPRYELETDPFHLAAPPAKPVPTAEAEPVDADAPAVAAMASTAAKAPATDPVSIAAATVADALSAPDAPAATASPSRTTVTVEKNVTAAVPVITVPAAVSGAGNGAAPTIDVILRVSIPVSDLTSAIPTIAVTTDPGTGGKPTPAAETPTPAAESPAASDDAPDAASVEDPLPAAAAAEAPAPAVPEPPTANAVPAAPATEAVAADAPVPDAPPAAEDSAAMPDTGAASADEVPAAGTEAPVNPAPPANAFDLSRVDRLLREQDAGARHLL